MLLVATAAGHFSFLSAQPYFEVSKFYGIESGLSDRKVFDIKKDSLGFLWVATGNGLDRYDGVSFLNFTAGNVKDLPSSQIAALDVLDRNCLALRFADQPGWFSIFSTTHATVKNHRFPGTGNDLSIGPDGAIYMVATRQDSIVVYSLISGQKIRKLYALSAPASDSREARIRVLRDGRHLVFDGKGQWMLCAPSGQVLRHIDSPVAGGIAAFLEDRDGLIWVVFDHAGGVFNLEATAAPFFQQNRAFSQTTRFSHLWSDSSGNLALSEYYPNSFYIGGLHVLDGATKQVHRFEHLLRNDNRITVLWAENFFDYLLAGAYVGIYKVNTTLPPVQYVQHLPPNKIPSGRFGTIVRGIAEGKDGKIYFTKELRDWFVFDPESGLSDTLTMRDGRTGKRLRPNCCMSLTADAVGNIWGVSCVDNISEHNLLVKYEPSSGRAFVFECPEKSDIDFLVLDETKMGLWVVINHRDPEIALWYFDFNTKKFSDFTGRFKTESGWQGLKANALTLLVPGEWLFATDRGLFHLDMRRNSATPMLNQAQNDLGSISVMSFARFDSSRWLLGTEGRGLLLYNLKTNTVEKVYDKKDGLPDNRICAIQPDSAGNFWLGTFNGLSCFQPQARVFRNFYTEDGLSDNEMNRRASIRDHRGMLYFGSMNGLNYLRPAYALKQDQTPPGRIVLTHLLYYDQKDRKWAKFNANIDSLTRIVLSPRNRSLSLAVALTDYKSPEAHRFLYKIEGYPEYAEWQLMENNRNLDFDYLPAGRYLLGIRALNHNNIPIREEKWIELLVEEYFYRQTWFPFACLAFLGLVFYGYYRYSVRQIIKIERLRTGISSDLHDEVGGLLAGVAMQAELLEDNVEAKLRPMLQRIAKNAREASAAMRDIVWSIDARRDFAADVVLRMKDHAAETLAIAGIETTWRTQIFTEKDKMYGQERHHLFLIYKELVTNCLKHSHAKNVHIELSRQPHLWYFSFQDDGVGYRTDEVHSGQGMSNIRMRAEKMKAEVVFLNGPGFGVQISIPFLRRESHTNM
jgi:signal transduction histidine kinase